MPSLRPERGSRVPPLLTGGFWPPRIGARTPDPHGEGVGHFLDAQLANFSCLVAPRRVRRRGGALCTLCACLARGNGDALLRPPPHAEHLPERFGLFTIIVRGKVFIASLYGLAHGHHFVPRALIPAALGMLTCFLFWWAISWASRRRTSIASRGAAGSWDPGFGPCAFRHRHPARRRTQSWQSLFRRRSLDPVQGDSALHCDPDQHRHPLGPDPVRMAGACLRTGGHCQLSGAVLVPAALGRQISATDTLGVIASILTLQVGLDRLRPIKTTNPVP